jgi:hypothetical protein
MRGRAHQRKQCGLLDGTGLKLVALDYQTGIFAVAGDMIETIGGRPSGAFSFGGIPDIGARFWTSRGTGASFRPATRPVLF